MFKLKMAPMLESAKSNKTYPEKYFKGLTPKETEQRLKELDESTALAQMGIYKELPTDVIARKRGLVKGSSYREIAKKRGFDLSLTGSLEGAAKRALMYYGIKSPTSGQISKLTQDLEQIYRKGMAAWGTGGHRPGASQRGWAMSRVASFLVGGKAAWTADNKQFNNLPEQMQKAIIAEMDEVKPLFNRNGSQESRNRVASWMMRWPYNMKKFYA